MDNTARFYTGRCSLCPLLLLETWAALKSHHAKILQLYANFSFFPYMQGTKDEGRAEGECITGKAGSDQEDRCQGSETLHKRFAM